MAAEIPEIGFRQHIRNGERNAADTERENRAVRNLVYDELCDLDICLRRSFVSSYRKRLMSALYDIIRLGEMDTVGTVNTLKLRIMFIDLKDHSSCTLKHGSPCEV